MATISVKRPIDNKPFYLVQDASPSEIQEVYATAQSAFESIRNLSIQERLFECTKISHYIVEHRERLINRIVQENGKSRFDALVNEIYLVLSVIEYYQKNAIKILADKRIPTPLVLLGKKSKVVYEPLGPVLIIAPWNYPLYQSIVPILSAFIAGNSVIFKPSELTPLPGFLEQIFNQSGFIQDAVQVVFGGSETGKHLIEARPAKIFFIGSLETGKKIMAQAAQSMIPVDLELGGKDPMIVFEDTNLEKAVNGALWGALTNCGQACISIERLYVHKSIYKPFTDSLKKKIYELTLTTGNENASHPVDLGVMTSEKQITIVEDHINDAAAKGAEVIMAGKKDQNPFFYPPVLVLGVNHTMKVMTEETFGPVLPVMPFETEEEAIWLANDTIYGLGASVWSADLNRAERVARKLHTGMVSINNVLLTAANPALPFGGVKASGFGRYKGEWGLLIFSNVKSIIIDRVLERGESHWFPYTANKYQAFSELIDSLYSKRKSFWKFLKAGFKLNILAGRERLK